MRIIDAVRLPNGGWARLDSLGDTLRILQSDVASVLLQSIRSPEGHAAEVVAQAISGPESEELAWYLAASIEARPSQVVVVVMEEAGSDQVVVVGQTLLAAAVSAP
ncbi:MAG: hypothetical protein GTO49_01380 [Anaerolineae bacterium]|nr:hypothetical protein [Anaerolineae bacterium]